MEILFFLFVPLVFAVLGIGLIANALESIKDTLDKNRK
jgi:hypothetical protein